MRQQEAHLVMRERVLARPERLAPDLLRRGLRKWRRHKLVPDVWRDPALRADAPGQRVQEVKRARDLPAPEVSGGGASPDMRSERRTGFRDFASYLDDRF